jgi:hypothetical protein
MVAQRRGHSTKSLGPGDLRVGKPFHEMAQPEKDLSDPLHPTRMIPGPPPWHKDAIYLREEEGLSLRAVAKLCGVSYSPVQRLFNPESARRQKIAQAKRDLHRRHHDPEYRDQSREYRRKYQQFNRLVGYVDRDERSPQ